jgi:hypothetical protein
MNARQTPVSSSANSRPLPTSDGPMESQADWPLMPTETEIYIMPDGQVVFADLPVELSELVEQLGDVEPSAVGLNAEPDIPDDTPSTSPHEDT